MTRPTITDLATVKSWQIGVQSEDDAGLNRCLAAASDAIESATSRHFGKGRYTELHDGRAALSNCGTRHVALYTRFFPIIADDDNPIVVTENGVTLPVVTTPTGQTPAGDCVVLSADDGLLLRAVSRGVGMGYDIVPWAEGCGTVTIDYAAGYEADAAPDAIVQACCELAWLFYLGKTHVGVGSSSKNGKTASYQNRLSDDARRAIDNAARVLRPVTAI